jgi:hypothetical protein
MDGRRRNQLARLRQGQPHRHLRRLTQAATDRSSPSGRPSPGMSARAVIVAA